MEGTPTYLLAEDDADICDLVRLGLRINGLSATIVRDGLAAAELATEQPFALIMLDRHMPKMDGMKAAHVIRTSALNEQTPILFLSGDNFETDEIENSYLLEKPFTVGELVMKIRQLSAD